MQNKVPFYGNTPDNTHCFQATIRSVLAYFMPDRTFTFEELDVLSAKIDGLATWPQAMLLSLASMGFDVTVIENFDAQRFIDEGAAYLVAAYGREASTWQIANSDIAQERRIYKELVTAKNVTIEQRPATTQDITQFLDSGYLVQAMINSKVLHNKKGYAGHSVLIYGYNEEGLYMHDPGLPAQESAYISYSDFYKAWASPDDTATNIIAINYRQGDTI